MRLILELMECPARCIKLSTTDERPAIGISSNLNLEIATYRTVEANLTYAHYVPHT